MKLRNRILRLIITVFITLSFVVPYISPYATRVAQAEQLKKAPTTMVSEKTLYVGYYDFTVKFKNLDKNAVVTYTTSNKAVVTVSTKGVIKPIAAGKATVTAKIKQNNNVYTSTIKVTVKKPSITITSMPKEITVGTPFLFYAVPNGIKNASLTWYSSDPSIATIDKKSGMFQALSLGTVKITVKDVKSGVKKEVTVKVATVEIKPTTAPEVTSTPVTEDYTEPEVTTAPVSEDYIAPEGSDKAVYISGLDLSKVEGTSYTTKREEYIETSRFILYLDSCIEVPVNVIDLINHIMNLIEDKTGYLFYTKRFSEPNEFNMDYLIEKFFETGKELVKVNAKHDKISIAVSQQDWGACAFGSHGVLLLPEDIKLLDGNEYVLIHELLHVIDMRNGCYLGQTLGEGFTTYYSTLITKEDTVLNGYYDGYSQLSNFNYKLTEDSMEALFTQMSGGWSSYQLGFRMINFIFETYGVEAFHKMQAKLSEQYANPTEDIVAAALKSNLSEDFFQAFARWYSKNYAKFGDRDMSNVGDWLIAGGYLQMYYGNDAEVIIPDTVTYIQEGVFRDNKTMISVKIPDGVTDIGGGAFYNCDSLREIVIPDSVTRISECAFEESNSLSKVILPKGITIIDVRTFLGCVSLKEITIPEGVTDIKANAFSDCSALTSIKLPSTLQSIGDYAFSSCKKLESITIPDSVKSFGEGVFNGCNASLTIYGKSGSYAEAYAIKNKIKFSVID